MGGNCLVAVVTVNLLKVSRTKLPEFGLCANSLECPQQARTALFNYPPLTKTRQPPKNQPNQNGS